MIATRGFLRETAPHHLRETAPHHLRYTAHRVTARMVPLLDGGWLYDATCQCGNTTHGQAATQHTARHSVWRRLACGNSCSSMQVQYVSDDAVARRLLRLTGTDALPVRAPYGKVSVPYGIDANVITVDASARPYGWGVAAVTGRGWVAMERETVTPCSMVTLAEVAAIALGMNMLPVGATGLIFCDNQQAVNAVNSLGDSPWWMPDYVTATIKNSRMNRQVEVRWLRRRSTRAAELADDLARAASRDVFDAEWIGRRLSWVRSPEGHQRLIYPYVTSNGDVTFDTH